MKIIVPKKTSQTVTNFDEIKDKAPELQAVLERGDFNHGPFHKNHIALHHSQVDENPYNFFVIKRSIVGAKDNEIIAVINPKIIERDEDSKSTHTEGCISFPFRQDKKVQRYDRVKVQYQVADDKGNLTMKEEWTEGLMARVFQHEIQHAQGGNIYQ